MAETNEYKGAAVDAVVCKCEKLCIRESTSTDSDILEIVDRGTTLKCTMPTEKDGKWCKVSAVNDKEIDGYCMCNYVKESNSGKEVKDGRRS